MEKQKQPKKIETISDGYNVSVVSIKDALEFKAPEIDRLLNFVKQTLDAQKQLGKSN